MEEDFGMKVAPDFFEKCMAYILYAYIYYYLYWFEDFFWSPHVLKVVFKGISLNGR